jgi:hypothetical protein
MQRREISKAMLLGPAAAGAFLARNATAQSSGRPGYPPTKEEVAAKVTPADNSYPPGDVRRYGALGDWDGAQGADDTAALQNALNCNATVFLPRGRFRTSATLTIPATVQIMGSGGDVCSIEPQECDGLSFAPSHGIGPTTLSGFAVWGNPRGRNSFVGIKCPGSSDPAAQVHGIRLENVRIHFFNTAVSLRTFWHSSLRGCVFNHVYHGVKILGQSCKLSIDDCQMVCDLSQGHGGAIGVLIDSTADYDPGHKTRLRPESILLQNNLIYGFDHGVAVADVLDLRVLHNVLDYCTYSGIELTTCDGTCTVQDNWIALNSSAKVYGIRLVPVSIPASSIRNIRDNFIVATAALAGSCGISVESLQNHCSISGNTLSGFTQADIYTQGAAHASILNNRCGSTAASHSIFSATARGAMTLEGNFCAAAILLNAAADGSTPRIVSFQP